MRTWRNYDTRGDGDRMLVDTPGMSDAEEISLAPLPSETQGAGSPLAVAARSSADSSATASPWRLS